jgi:hypothetical protein
MQIRATIIKLLSSYQPDELLRHISNEMEQQSTHYRTVGAPIRADYIARQIAVIRNAANELTAIPYQKGGSHER